MKQTAVMGFIVGLAMGALLCFLYDTVTFVLLGPIAALIGAGTAKLMEDMPDD